MNLENDKSHKIITVVICNRFCEKKNIKETAVRFSWTFLIGFKKLKKAQISPHPVFRDGADKQWPQTLDSPIYFIIYLSLYLNICQIIKQAAETQCCYSINLGRSMVFLMKAHSAVHISLVFSFIKR